MRGGSGPVSSSSLIGVQVTGPLHRETHGSAVFLPAGSSPPPPRTSNAGRVDQEVVEPITFGERPNFLEHGMRIVLQ